MRSPSLSSASSSSSSSSSSASASASASTVPVFTFEGDVLESEKALLEEQARSEQLHQFYHGQLQTLQLEHQQLP